MQRWLWAGMILGLLGSGTTYAGSACNPSVQGKWIQAASEGEEEEEEEGEEQGNPGGEEGGDENPEEGEPSSEGQG